MEIRLEDARVNRLREARMPFVGIGHPAQDEQMCWVDVDYAGLIGHCVRHLADLGHRQIALLNRSPELLATGYGPGHRARSGFLQAVGEHQLQGIELPCGDDARSLRSHP